MKNNINVSQKSILFIYLNAFSGTGGIEKFNACFMKSIYENSLNTSINYTNISLIDNEIDSKYLPKNLLKTFNKNKYKAILYALFKILKADIVILGHTNLLILGLWTLLFPNKKLVLVAHGIEIWQKLPSWKKKILQHCDSILAVSNYTKQQIIDKQQVQAAKIQIFHNTINPFFECPKTFDKPDYLMEKYKLNSENQVFLTLARLSSAEQYKGYDTVLEALPKVLKIYPTCKYVIAGKYDELEYQRIMNIIKDRHLENNVILTGFVKNNELIDHYLLADTFIMPSRGEGFGIVYLEAMACGVSVIAGNIDGSVDALRQGELGTLVNPESIDEIAKAMIKQIEQPLNNTQKIDLQQKVIQYFGFEEFKKQTLKKVINL